MIQQTTHEKRRAQRFPTQTSAKLKNMNGTSWYSINIINLSKTGACVTGTFSRKVGAYIELLIPGQGKHHSVVAQVVWSEGDKAGIKFHA